VHESRTGLENKSKQIGQVVSSDMANKKVFSTNIFHMLDSDWLKITGAFGLANSVDGWVGLANSVDGGVGLANSFGCVLIGQFVRCWEWIGRTLADAKSLLDHDGCGISLFCAGGGVCVSKRVTQFVLEDIGSIRRKRELGVVR